MRRVVVRKAVFMNSFRSGKTFTSGMLQAGSWPPGQSLDCSVFASDRLSPSSSPEVSVPWRAVDWPAGFLSTSSKTFWASSSSRGRPEESSTASTFFSLASSSIGSVPSSRPNRTSRSRLRALLSNFAAE